MELCLTTPSFVSPVKKYVALVCHVQAVIPTVHMCVSWSILSNYITLYCPSFVPPVHKFVSPVSPVQKCDTVVPTLLPPLFKKCGPLGLPDQKCDHLIPHLSIQSILLPLWSPLWKKCMPLVSLIMNIELFYHLPNSEVCYSPLFGGEGVHGECSENM